uniref:Uncharacterized protein n=1 Tax=Romanomermis culicivorax TaxID=13658 RepID=A0A915JTU7_ROMCU
MPPTNAQTTTDMAALEVVVNDVATSSRSSSSQLSTSNSIILHCETFAKKFCGHRWLENVDVVERALRMIPLLKKYVENVKTRPTVGSFDKAEASLKCVMLEARLEFFKAIATQLEPYLTQFQTDKPMAPYLFDQLTMVAKSLAARIINVNVMNACDNTTKLLHILDDKKKFKDVLKTDIGFGAKNALSAKATELQKAAFYQECAKFVSTCLAKIFERSPLKLRATKSISFCLPGLIKQHPTIATSRLKNLLEILLDKKWLTSSECDRCLIEFQHIIKTPAIASSTFDDKSDRLDKFWLNGDVIGTSLIKVLKIVLSLSHGNASVESGFSINDDLLVENLQEASLINQRMVYDSIKHHGGPSNIDITKELLKSVKASSSRYKSALDEKKQQKAFRLVEKFPSACNHHIFPGE